MSVVAFPGTNWRDYATLAKEFAEQIGAGKFGQVDRVAIIMDTDHGVHCLTWGEMAPPLYMMGMFQAASMMAFADGLEDE